MKSSTNRLRPRLLAGGAGARATAGLGPFGRAAFAQAATTEMPFGHRTSSRIPRSGR